MMQAGGKEAEAKELTTRLRAEQSSLAALMGSKSKVQRSRAAAEQALSKAAKEVRAKAISLTNTAN